MTTEKGGEEIGRRGRDGEKRKVVNVRRGKSRKIKSRHESKGNGRHTVKERGWQDNGTRATPSF